MPRRHDYSLEAFINIREARGQSSDSRQSYTSYVYLLVGAKRKVSWTVNSSLLGQGIPPAGWEQKHPKQHQFEYLSIWVSESLSRKQPQKILTRSSYANAKPANKFRCWTKLKPKLSRGQTFVWNAFEWSEYWSGVLCPFYFCVKGSLCSLLSNNVVLKIILK